MDKIEIIKSMIENNPCDGNLWYLLGVEYSDIDNKDEAIIAFSEAIKFCDDELKSKISSQLANLVSKGRNYAKIELSNIDRLERTTENSNDTRSNEEKIIPFSIFTGGKQKRDSVSEVGKVTIKFKDVGGLEELKEAIRMKIIKPFTNQGLFDKFKKKIGGGILLFGPPGCGKTYMAKATAGECGANFKAVHITDILNKYIGESEQNIHDIFSNARSQKPCIIFFDEIDTIGFNRSKLTAEHMRPMIEQLLTEIEGIDSNTEKLLIIGATNMPWDVDPAFKRPGRFDKTIFVPPPDILAREIIFKLKLEDKPAENIDYGILARKTELYSGADIDNVVEVATENVISEILKSGNERAINMKDILIAIDITKPSTTEWLRTIKNYIKYANQSGLYDDVEKFINNHRNLL